MTAASSPGEPSLDLAEQMNQKIRDSYVLGALLGSGTYANVYAGHYRSDPTRLVAVKKIKINKDWKDGMPMDAIREIRVLQELSHPHVIRLHDVYSTKNQQICMVLEHLPLGDLEQLWKNTAITYSAADVKSWANMICQGVWWTHENFILHRDIKGNNLLIAADGTIKLADFGLARPFADPNSRRPMTRDVITTYYRPPELFYGARFYSSKVDVWSVGVVICELVIRNFFLPGNTDIESITMISDLLGPPTEESWPGVTKLPNFIDLAPKNTGGPRNVLPPRKGQPLAWWRSRLALIGDDGIDVVRGMLTADPKKRLDSKQVLQHAYWTNTPRPTEPALLPRKGGGEKKMAEDLKRRAGEAETTNRGEKIARKLDFASMAK